MLAPTLAAARLPANAHAVWQSPRGTPVMIRSMVPQDAALLQTFVRRLSPASRYQRFHSTLKELSPVLLERFTRHGHDAMALIAVIHERGEETMIGEARYISAGDGSGATELAVAVADDWQSMGLGTALLAELARHARRNGIKTLRGDILSDNTAMLRLARKLGALRRYADDARLTRVEAVLGSG